MRRQRLAHNSVVSSVFVFLNLIEVTLIGAIWLKAAGQPRHAAGAFYDSFQQVSQLGASTVSGHWAKASQMVTEVAALVLLVGGVAILIAKVQSALAGMLAGRLAAIPSGKR